MNKLSSVLIDGGSLNKLKNEGGDLYSLPKLTREELENLLEPEGVSVTRLEAGLDAKFKKLWNEYIQLREQSDKFEEKIKSLSDILEIDPENFIAWYEKGVLFFDLREHKEAIVCFEKALKMCQEKAHQFFDEQEAKFFRARILFSLGSALSLLNWDQNAPNIELEQRAIEYLDKAIEIDPNNANAWGVKGNAVSKLAVIEKNESRRKRMYEESIECYDKAIELDPKMSGALLGKGLTLALLGKKEESLVCLDKAIEMDPSSKMENAVKKLKKVYDLSSN